MSPDTSKTHALLNFFLSEVSLILSLKEEDAKPPHKLAKKVLQYPLLARVGASFLVSSKEDATKLEMLQSQIKAALTDLGEGKTAAAIAILEEWSAGLETGSRHEFPNTMDQVFVGAAREAKCTCADIEKVLQELQQRPKPGSFKHFSGPPPTPIPIRRLDDESTL